uniref:Ras-GAP domain-containing protein n=1 Tax=Arcella intermedia TaxID=1963864 RepID=A0A6B2KX46_9EUKA
MMYSDKEALLLEDILQMLVVGAPRTLHCMLENVEPSEQESLARSLVNLSFGPNVSTALLEFFLKEEFNYGKEILRENGVLIKFLKPYLKVVGQQYLEQLIYPLVKEVCFNDKHMSYEIDPIKVDRSELPKNRDRLVVRIHQFLEFLTSPKMLEAMPIGIRYLCKIVSELSTKVNPGSEHVYIGSLIILRFINPAVFSPEAYNLIPKHKPPSAYARRNLILISKVLQNLSNNTSSNKKEAYMNYIFEEKSGISADFKSWQNILYEWFDKIVEVGQSDLCFQSNILPSVSVYDLHALHTLVSKLEPELLKIYKSHNPNEAEVKDLKSLMDRLGSCQTKENFTILEDQSRKLLKNILESRNEEAFYIGYISYEKPSQGKTSIKIIVIGLYRIFILSKKGKIFIDKHFLSLNHVDSPKSDKLKLCFNDLELGLTTSEATQIIVAMKKSCEQNFGSTRLFTISVSPPARTSELEFTVPADYYAFSNTFRSLCDYYLAPSSEIIEKICWHLQNFHPEAEVLDLNNLQVTTDEETAALIHSLSFNTQFKRLRMQNIKSQEFTFKALISMAKMNQTLTSIELINIGPKKEFSKFFSQLVANDKIPLKTLSIPANELDKSTVFTLSSYIRIANLTNLNLTLCFTKPERLKMFMDSLLCSSIHNSLENLKIGRTKFTDGISFDLFSFISSCQNLVDLTLHETGISLQHLKVASKKIKKLNISRNKFSREQWKSLAEFLSESSSVIEELNISSTLIPQTALEDILTIKEGNFSLKASSNNFGEEIGSTFNKLNNQISCIDKLDLSDNMIGDSLAYVVESCSTITCLIELNISGNFQICNDKNKIKLVKSLEMLASSSNIEVLIMSGCSAGKLKESIVPFLFELMNNKHLQVLDIGCHSFGDKGAMALGKLLQKNTTLTSISYDDNGIGLAGLKLISQGLARNKHIKWMPPPFLDIPKILNEQPLLDKNLFALLQKIQLDIQLRGT